MHRLIVVALLAVASVGSWAQKFDPQVAYVILSGRSTSLVLANQDGANAVTVFSSNKALSGIDFAPGGGRIAFSEQGTLKVLAYTASNAGIAVDSVTTLDDTSGAGDPDFSPDGQKILYVGNMLLKPQIREIAATGGTPKILMDNMSGVTDVAWVSAQQFAYRRQFASDGRVEVNLVSLDSQGDVASETSLLTTAGATDGLGDISDLDVARTTPSILVTLHYPTEMRVVEYSLIDMQSFTDHVAGFRAHFSNDDQKIIYLDSSRRYLNSFDVGTGVSRRLTKKGGVGATDARP